MALANQLVDRFPGSRLADKRVAGARDELADLDHELAEFLECAFEAVNLLLGRPDIVNRFVPLVQAGGNVFLRIVVERALERIWLSVVKLFPLMHVYLFSICLFEYRRVPVSGERLTCDQPYEYDGGLAYCSRVASGKAAKRSARWRRRFRNAGNSGGKSETMSSPRASGEESNARSISVESDGSFATSALYEILTGSTRDMVVLDRRKKRETVEKRISAGQPKARRTAPAPDIPVL